MTTLMFQERFAELVRTGQKLQTIRPRRKRPIYVGDTISLRKWIGAAYRSKQLELAKGTCIGTYGVWIGEDEMLLAGDPLGPMRRREIAKLDGFKTFEEMLMWFEDAHGLPFDGDLIRWEFSA